MKISSTAKIWIAIVIVILIPKIAYNLLAYAFIIDEPQRANLLPQKTIVQSESILINERLIAESATWYQVGGFDVDQFLEKPKDITIEYNALGKSSLSGVIFSIKINLEELGFSANPPNAVNENLSKILSIWVSSNDEERQVEIFGDEVCRNAKYIDLDFSPESIEPNNIELQLEQFKQGKKSLVLKGKVKINNLPLLLKSTNPCNNPQDLNNQFKNFLLTINDLKIDIDSPVIYEWSNKAGKTWRL